MPLGWILRHRHAEWEFDESIGDCGRLQVVVGQNAPGWR